MNRRLSACFTYLAMITLSLLAAALPAQAELVAGRDYAMIVPVQITDNPARLEVLEFFSYGCPHCNEFNPLVSKWSAALPGDVVFKRVPVSFGRPQWANLSRFYYALEVTGDLVRLDAAVFNAIYKEGSKLYDDKSIIEWVSAQGVDGKKFTDAYNSFGVVSKAKRADHMVQAYNVRGIPALAVDGKYLVATKEGKGFADLLAVTDHVIVKARGEHGKK